MLQNFRANVLKALEFFKAARDGATSGVLVEKQVVPSCAAFPSSTLTESLFQAWFSLTTQAQALAQGRPLNIENIDSFLSPH